LTEGHGIPEETSQLEIPLEEQRHNLEHKVLFVYSTAKFRPALRHIQSEKAFPYLTIRIAFDHVIAKFCDMKGKGGRQGYPTHPLRMRAREASNRKDRRSQTRSDKIIQDIIPFSLLKLANRVVTP